MKISDRTINVEQREQGAWVEQIPEWDGLRLKVRGIGNADWARMEQKQINAVPRKRRMNGIEKPDRDRINGILLRETALLDWDGVEDDDGKPLPYSKELAGKYLSEPQYEPFRDAVFWAASVVAEQRAADIKDDAGN